MSAQRYKEQNMSAESQFLRKKYLCFLPLFSFFILHLTQMSTKGTKVVGPDRRKPFVLAGYETNPIRRL